MGPDTGPKSIRSWHSPKLIGSRPRTQETWVLRQDSSEMGPNAWPKSIESRHWTQQNWILTQDLRPFGSTPNKLIIKIIIFFLLILWIIIKVIIFITQIIIFFIWILWIIIKIIIFIKQNNYIKKPKNIYNTNYNIFILIIRIIIKIIIFTTQLILFFILMHLIIIKK
jgi:hypothetical protein